MLLASEPNLLRECGACGQRTDDRIDAGDVLARLRAFGNEPQALMRRPL